MIPAPISDSNTLAITSITSLGQHLGSGADNSSMAAEGPVGTDAPATLLGHHLGSESAAVRERVAIRRRQRERKAAIADWQDRQLERDRRDKREAERRHLLDMIGPDIITIARAVAEETYRA